MNSNSDPMTLQAVLDRLDGVIKSSSGYIAKCPAHEDREPSLSITEAADGKVLLNCFAGCAYEDVRSALGFSKPVPVRSSKKIVATYDYLNADGDLRYQVVRYEPKDFRQRRPDGKGDWLWNMKGIETCLFRLPELLAAKAKGSGAVFIVEGENGRTPNQ